MCWLGLPHRGFSGAAITVQRMLFTNCGHQPHVLMGTLPKTNEGRHKAVEPDCPTNEGDDILKQTSLPVCLHSRRDTGSMRSSRLAFLLGLIGLVRQVLHKEVIPWVKQHCTVATLVYSSIGVWDWISEIAAAHACLEFSSAFS
eukprot:2300993-Amphidinium_carterae.2